MYCAQNEKIILWCDIEHVRILLLLLFYFIGVHCCHGMNIFLMGTPLHTGVNLVHFKATFTLCPSPYPSPCPYQSPCPNNSHFLIKLEAVFRLHQFPYQSPIQCHHISVRSVSICPPTVKNWYGRPFLSESCKSLYKITLWRLARQLWT